MPRVPTHKTDRLHVSVVPEPVRTVGVECRPKLCVVPQFAENVFQNRTGLMRDVGSRMKGSSRKSLGEKSVVVGPCRNGR